VTTRPLPPDPNLEIPAAAVCPPTDPEDDARRAWRGSAFLRNPLAVIGLFVLLLTVAFCFIGPLLYHTDQTGTDIANAFLPPSGEHPLGTDSVGRDQLGRMMAGGQNTIKVSVVAAVLATAFGTLWGATAGYLGGIVDGLMMRIVDAGLSIPPLFLMLFTVAITRPTLPKLIALLAGVSWLASARLIRGEALALRNREYVLASKGMGTRTMRIIGRHIIPNTIGTILVNATFQVADAILALAALSFLGLGIQAPATDWGALLSDGAETIYNGYWWLIWPPGVAIVLLVVAFNFLGDALRVVFEVRLQS
jgi:peptide/nickel transport system permease protein